ncbi:hypothetical protein ABK040_015326 [Willaertia magna]
MSKTLPKEVDNQLQHEFDEYRLYQKFKKKYNRRALTKRGIFFLFNTLILIICTSILIPLIILHVRLGQPPRTSPTYERSKVITTLFVIFSVIEAFTLVVWFSSFAYTFQFCCSFLKYKRRFHGFQIEEEKPLTIHNIVAAATSGASAEEVKEEEAILELIEREKEKIANEIKNENEEDINEDLTTPTTPTPPLVNDEIESGDIILAKAPLPPTLRDLHSRRRSSIVSGGGHHQHENEVVGFSTIIPSITTAIHQQHHPHSHIPLSVVTHQSPFVVNLTDTSSETPVLATRNLLYASDSSESIQDQNLESDLQKNKSKSLTNNNEKDIPILKVNQLDSDRLDFEIENYLFNYFKRITKHFTIMEQYEPEIMLLIRIFIYKYSIYDHSQTFGDTIQNLKYTFQASRFEKSPPLYSKLLFAFLSIGVPYIYERYIKNTLMVNDSFNNLQNNQQNLVWYKNLKKIEYYYKVFEFINFILFLYQGKYKTLLERFLGWRKVYATRFMIRQLSFDYMNSELIWNGLAETILFIAPLINFRKIYFYLKRIFVWMFPLKQTTINTVAVGVNNNTSSVNNGSDNHDKKIVGINRFSKENSDSSNNSELVVNEVCPYCSADPILVPFVSSDTKCKHRFCYYCIESALLNDSNDHRVNCPLCNQEITSVKRLGS